MQTITDSETGNSLIVKRNRLEELKEATDEDLDAIKIFEVEWTEKRNHIMRRGWHVGARLAEMKEIVGHGSWEKWVPLNLPGLGEAVGTRLQNAKRYMRFWKDNQSPRVRQLVEDERDPFSADSKRRFMFGYVPPKDRPKLKDPHFPRSASVQNLVNEYSRLKQRHVTGLQLVSMREAKAETGELKRWLDFVHGESAYDPWAS
jgi:hypothetical protein